MSDDMKLFLVTVTFFTDYIDTNEIVTFDLGMVVGCVDIQVIEDRLVEGNETLNLVVTSDDPAVMLLNNQVEISIFNTDGKFSFSRKCGAFDYP